MKALTISLLAVIIPRITFSQDISAVKSLWRTYISVADSINKQFHCTKETYSISNSEAVTRIVTNRAFDSLFKPILSNVFIGSSNLTQNSTSASFVQDATKGSININYVWRPNNSLSHFISGGVFSKGSNSILGIYSNGSWANEIGLTLGYSWVRGKTIFYNQDTCEKISEQRPKQLRKIIESYKKTINQNKNNLTRTQLEKEIDTLKSHLDSILNPSVDADFIAMDSTKSKYEQFLLDDRLIIPKDLKDTSFYYDKLEADLANWEVLQNVRTGYKLFWFGPNLSISNNSISLLDSIPKEYKTLYSKKNQLKILLGANISSLRSTSRTLLYSRLDINFSKGNYLDNSIYSKPKAIYNPGDQNIYVADEDIPLIGKYNDLKANIWSFEPNFYVGCFFTANKQVGLDVTLGAKLAPKLPENISYKIYPSTFTAVVGPIFRLLTDKSISQGTVSIQIGFVDSQFNTNVWESFSAKFKVGIPFNALIK